MKIIQFFLKISYYRFVYEDPSYFHQMLGENKILRACDDF